MEEIYANVDYAKPSHPGPSTNCTGPGSFKRSFRFHVIPTLGLLNVFLLIGLITLGVHYQDSATELSAMNNIISFMTGERDLLHANLTEKTKELERLQSLAKQKKTCPSRWSMVGCSCYHLSERSGTWDQGRKDCRDKGADLVVIDSAEEQNFLASLTRNPAWIGLNDKEEEGTWKWIDGTPLTVKYWESSQPDNGGGSLRWGEEDCAHIRTLMTASWNDFSCEASLPWVCEKIL